VPGRNLPPAAGRLPDSPGVYRFLDASDRVLYIGRATSLRSRVASYWSQLGDRAHLAPMVDAIVRIEAVSCGSVHEAAWLERNLLEASLPRWNRTPGGQESAVYIRLDPGPARPGLSVVYRPEPAGQARYFGPYLGGLRVRLAVAALHRLAPLRYAGTSPDGAGRDLARVRGVAVADRGDLARRLTSILDREPAAVGRARDELARLRDRAAGNLGFELAGRIQAEIGALSWVTSQQRVAAAAGPNLTVAGWSGGVQVRFVISDGRLNGWSQRACAPAEAADAVAATAAEWRGFAQLNAELAASLLG
jgi:excinuclease ABC subunit C